MQRSVHSLVRSTRDLTYSLAFFNWVKQQPQVEPPVVPILFLIALEPLSTFGCLFFMANHVEIAGADVDIGRPRNIMLRGVEP